MKNNKLHPIMFAGTGSDVGKSVVAAGFCRIFLQDQCSGNDDRGYGNDQGKYLVFF